MSKFPDVEWGTLFKPKKFRDMQQCEYVRYYAIRLCLFDKKYINISWGEIADTLCKRFNELYKDVEDSLKNRFKQNPKVQFNIKSFKESEDFIYIEALATKDIEESNVAKFLAHLSRELNKDRNWGQIKSTKSNNVRLFNVEIVEIKERKNKEK